MSERKTCDKGECHRQDLQASLRVAVNFLRRYRTETPLGNKPHMIAGEVDAFLEKDERK